MTILDTVVHTQHCSQYSTIDRFCPKRQLSMQPTDRLTSDCDTPVDDQYVRVCM